MAKKSNKSGGNNQIATVSERKKEVRTMLNHNKGEFAKALGKMIDPDQFLRVCMTTFQRGGEQMMSADPRSFVAACVEAAQLGLKPDSILGECYLLPRWNRELNSNVVTFQLGYPGLIKLVRRGGEVSEIAPEVVHENDEFQVFLGTERRIVHRPWYALGEEEPGKVVASYATAKLRDGTVMFKVVSLPELTKAAEASGNPKDNKWSNVWQKHFEAMAMKTAVLRLGKWLPMPDDAKRVIARDEAREAGVIDEDIREALERLSSESHKATPSGPQSLDDLIPNDEVIDTEGTDRAASGE